MPIPLPPSAPLAAALTTAEMYAADQAAMAAGISGPALMEAAGRAVAMQARRHLPYRRPVVVLCGPGNNGGDGFVAARLLTERGWPVRVGLLGRRDALRGDAAWAAGRWDGPVRPLSPALLEGAGGVIDALFGAGLSRPLDGVAAETLAAVNALRLPCLAVDVPSGVAGDTGEILGGVAPRCVATVTFFRPKPAHLLYPARGLLGHLLVADIGIPESVLEAIGPQTYINGPALWRLPSPGPQSHKYTRGHAVVLGGAEMTGAGRLAARAARRAGAGLLTVVAPAEALPLYAADAPGTLCLPDGDLNTLLADARRNAWLLGPGGGVGDALRRAVRLVLSAGRPCVLDADALTSFAGALNALRTAVRGPVVLTPHAGEFARLFAGSVDPALPRLDQARAAARAVGGVVLLKGPDTVIADPDGMAAVTVNAPPDLATGGSGDVLAGVILGLLAQGMEPFTAACAGAWLHAEAGRAAGPGLIAEDLPETLPAILARTRYADGLDMC